MSRLTLLFIALPALLGLAICTSFGLGVDEAHYMLYARHLDLSYFDHPPLVGWTHALFNAVLGESLFSARLPAILIGLFSNWQLFLFLRRLGFSEERSRWATLASGLCFQFFVLFVFLLPDTLCLLLFWPLLAVTSSLVEKPTVKKWLLLGLVLGLLGLAKYTALFFLVPVAIALIKRQGLSFLRGPGFYLGVVLAGFLILPVIIWNQEHGWISFLYQMGHVAGGGDGWQGFLKSWALQFVLYSPFLWPFAFVGFWHLWRRSSVHAEFALWTALTFGLFFLWSSWREVVLPHWPALFYLLTISVGLAKTLETRARAWALTMIALTGVFVLVLVVTLVSGAAYRIPGALREVAGWDEAMHLAGEKLTSPKDRIAVLNWTYASRALYYGPEVEKRVVVLDDRFDQFDVWNPESIEGLDLWILQFSYDEKDLTGIVNCQSLSEKERSPVMIRGFEMFQVILQKCVTASKPSGS